MVLSLYVIVVVVAVNGQPIAAKTANSNSKQQICQGEYPFSFMKHDRNWHLYDLLFLKLRFLL